MTVIKSKNPEMTDLTVSWVHNYTRNDYGVLNDIYILSRPFDNDFDQITVQLAEGENWCKIGVIANPAQHNFDLDQYLVIAGDNTYYTSLQHYLWNPLPLAKNRTITMRCDFEGKKLRFYSDWKLFETIKISEDTSQVYPAIYTVKGKALQILS